MVAVIVSFVPVAAESAIVLIPVIVIDRYVDAVQIFKTNHDDSQCLSGVQVLLAMYLLL